MPQSESPTQILRQMLLGKFVARSVGAVAQLGIADHLSAGPRAISALSELTGCDPDALYRVMRALATVGVFSEAQGREFALTPVSQLLRSEVRGSMRDLAQWLGAEPAGWRAWGALDHTLRTGEPGFEASEGEPVFSYLARTPAAGALFDAMMAASGEAEAQAVAQACELAWLERRVGATAVDVGGNNGALLRAILGRYPQLRGINFDTPAVIERTRAALDASGENGQLELMAGDFFQWVPGGDLYLLRRIVHDWSDPLAVRILRRCRESMAPGGRVLVVERPITADARGGAMWMDLEMMVMTRGGRERTIAEYAGLFAQAGLRMTGVTAAAGELAIVEGVAGPD